MNAGVSGGLPAALGGPHAALATRFPGGLGVGKPSRGRTPWVGKRAGNKRRHVHWVYSKYKSQALLR